jgi:hypothetical protein
MKKIGLILLALIILLVIAALFFFKKDTSDPYTSTTWGKFAGTCAAEDLPDDDFGKKFHSCDYSVPKDEIPVFNKASFPFENKFDGKRSLPLVGSALIDVDGDGVDEVFMAGGIDDEDVIYQYTDDGFVKMDINLPAKPSNTKTLGAVSFDLDNDGRTDLLLTGDYGVLWYRNTANGFGANKINVPLNDKTVAASLTLGDIDQDGDADMFVSGYIKLEQMEGQTIFKDFNYGGSSLLMLNNGDNTFADVTEAYGLSYVHNTFCAVFVDVDKDSFLDLVVAHDTGEVRTYKNEGGKSFTKKTNPTTGKYAYPMGIAVGDYNNDGNIDFFFSNTGSSVPTFMARGDLEKEDEYVSDWLLFKNNGNFNFTDAAKETKVADFEFSWGAIFEDFNLDGRQDLVVSENYVAFPPHKLFKLPGRFLVQRPDGTFSAVEDQAKVINKNYGITPLTSDFNQDGYPDLIFTNISGPVKAHINSGGDANFIAIRLPENAKYLGAIVTVTKSDGQSLTDTYVIGEGLASDQTATLTFGLGESDSINGVKVALAVGSSFDMNNPLINQINRL